MVKVSEPPEGNVASVKPDSSNAGLTVAGHTAPPLAAVHAAAVLLNPAAAASVSTEPSPDDEPAFATTIVYVVVPFALTVVTPSVLVTDRSTIGITVSVSLAVLLAGFESTVAGTVV